MLYELASSTDKTFKLYPGMWHALTSGEPEENMNLVFSDIIEWLDKRAGHANSRLEREQKFEHDLERGFEIDKKDNIYGTIITFSTYGFHHLFMR
ncbi:hypothetical protein RJ641_005487 [Dillenia turbinata]|uniref:Serine aminopeptidase S33 domain-containing protein n=1 Tax=Dillenia turbinata TaxID=194707 RepID=A0AAN8Z930_9MAGN